ncbi:hypothetical protein E8D34_12755 [Nocardioides sp. GY 10113]|uniref:hypothetical protein n=1 Tax=Nocardioides sp. GY 10113 TaxID=2569761 RepID=UPI0010A78DE0|nr:hypothetical protein [Nocardioides sp. GY 10113]TIC85959.1 hypothetical protein E8D34_12755 [Nocardioides sp. GY 10113]
MNQNEQQHEVAEPILQIEATLTPFTQRSRSVGISHTDAGLPRGLDLGEHVLVHDPATRTHFTGIVADIDFTLTDTVYRIELGTRVTSGEAAQWLNPVRERPAGGFTTRDVAHLLAALRRSEQGLAAAYREYAATPATDGVARSVGQI